MAKNTRVLRTELPNDVWDRFAAEAADKGVTKAAHLRNLIVARDRKRYDQTPVWTEEGSA